MADFSLESLSQVFIVAANGDVRGSETRFSPLFGEVPVNHRCVTSIEEIIATFQPHIATINLLRIMIVFEGQTSEQAMKLARESFPTVFLSVYNPQLASNPWKRLEYHKQGVNQVAYELSSIYQVIKDNIVIERSASSVDDEGMETRFGCHFCSLVGLTEDELWRFVKLAQLKIFHT
jgi:hypothetical protein